MGKGSASPAMSGFVYIGDFEIANAIQCLRVCVCAYICMCVCLYGSQSMLIGVQDPLAYLTQQ